MALDHAHVATDHELIRRLELRKAYREIYQDANQYDNLPLILFKTLIFHSVDVHVVHGCAVGAEEADVFLGSRRLD